MAHTPTTVLLVCMALLVGAQAQESLTFAPTNATGPFGTQVTGAPKGFDSVSATTTTLGPCVLRTLHTHAATELLYVVSGGLLSVQFSEDGSIIATSLTASGGKNGTEPQAVVYPVGREHLQYNPTCAPASFIAFFPVDVPGIKTINLNGTSFMKAVAKATEVSPAAVDAVSDSLMGIAMAANTPVPAGYAGVGNFTPAAVATFAFPASAAAQADYACLTRCGLAL